MKLIVIKNGWLNDVFSRKWRKYIGFRPGERKKGKKIYWRMVRHKEKISLKNINYDKSK